MTGSTDFKSWKSFEEEASSIWKNAWHYNEDGSEISLLAKDLQVWKIIPGDDSPANMMF